MTTAIRFAYQDYLQLPEDRRYEIVDGDLFMVPAPGPYHQRVSRNLEYHLHRFVTERDLGKILHAPYDVVLSETDVVQPDILFITKPRLSIVTETNIQSAPDLIVEILSPATAQRDRGVKQKLYARVGVAEYWIVDLATKSVEVLTLKAGTFQVAWRYGPQDTLVSPLLPGLAIPLPQVF
jgi:Uma2 family endonuclease